MMNFLLLTMLISFHLHLFQFKCYSLNFTMVYSLQVRAVLLPTNITAELSCNSEVYKYKHLKDCEVLCLSVLFFGCHLIAAISAYFFLSCCQLLKSCCLSLTETHHI